MIVFASLWPIGIGSAIGTGVVLGNYWHTFTWWLGF